MQAKILREGQFMESDLLNLLLIGFVACNILGWVVLFAVRHMKQYYIWKLCRYSGTGEKPGAACVICAYHHDCNRARQSTEYRQYSYCRRVLPNTAKELFDKIWEEERGPRPE